MIKLYQVIEILTSNMLQFADSGRMSREGISYFETPREITAVYNTAQLPYIVYQELGFTHYWRARSKDPAVRAKAFISVNQGFISEKATGKIERLIYSDMLGLPYNNLEDNQVIMQSNKLMMTELGVMKDV